jgi:hypothetical protein
VGRPARRGVPRHPGAGGRVRHRGEPLRVPLPPGVEGVRRPDERPADGPVVVLRAAPALLRPRPGDTRLPAGTAGAVRGGRSASRPTVDPWVPPRR